MFKVLIVDDWAILRSGIKQILSEEFGPLELTQGSPESESLDLASGPWDLAVVSVDVPSPGGVQFIAALTRAYPRQRVLALALRANISRVECALENSVRGLIAKESTLEEVVKAVRRAIAGAQRFVSKTSSSIGSEPAAKHTRQSGLSKRELEALQLLAAGNSIKEIAAALDVSPNTVSTYRVRLLRKLNLNSTAELIRYALRSQLAD